MVDPNEKMSERLEQETLTRKKEIEKVQLNAYCAVILAMYHCKISPDKREEITQKLIQLQAYYSVMLAFQEDKRAEITEKLIKEWNISTQAQDTIKAHLAAQRHMDDASSTPVVTAMQNPEGTSSAKAIPSPSSIAPLPDLDNEVVKKLHLQAFYSVMLAFEEDAKYQSKIPPDMRAEITEKLIKEWNISNQTEQAIKDMIKAHPTAQPHMGDASTLETQAMQEPLVHLTRTEKEKQTNTPLISLVGKKLKIRLAEHFVPYKITEYDPLKETHTFVSEFSTSSFDIRNFHEEDLEWDEPVFVKNSLQKTKVDTIHEAFCLLLMSLNPAEISEDTMSIITYLEDAWNITQEMHISMEEKVENHRWNILCISLMADLNGLDNEVVRKKELENVQLQAYYYVMLAFEEDGKHQSKIPPDKRIEITEKLIKEWSISTQTQKAVQDMIKAHLDQSPKLLKAEDTPPVSAPPNQSTEQG